ncbi:helix-turn-helix domain-containing protein [Seonamhaeicola algicola]|uniref:Helix-turn-helix domain-containing protein n=1 Tax=Seonamhaeicola algicola TaxID=1719036 RepID=A0A5C7ARA6_9FLAO|nr:AraC family transcriptional regulator [Seonamhaeicola algicola]TXE10143.1 helix-turn-helix domain-containing protein [Seonamhaeicola algicola]
MKLVLKNSANFVNKRISIVKKEQPCLDSAWHYHPEFELLYISKSSGIRFVGDNVSHFSSGELVLIGSYLPHLYRNDPAYYEKGGDLKVKTIVMKFTKNFMGEGTFDNPEFSEVAKLLDESKFGVLFDKSVSEKMHDEILEIVQLSKGEQSIRLLDFLYRLSQVEDKKALSSTDMRQFSTENPDRLDTVIKYISDNYMNTISLSDIANIACMTTNSFCRFFKKMTNKSFTEFLNEIRIRNAARMLVQENYPISEVCFLVGYKSIPNFNKQFKQIMGQTPKAYRYRL